MQLFSVDATTFSKFFLSIFLAPKNMKKTVLKRCESNIFLPVLPIGPKPAQITFSVSLKCLAKNFYIMTAEN